MVTSGYQQCISMCWIHRIYVCRILNIFRIYVVRSGTFGSEHKTSIWKWTTAVFHVTSYQANFASHHTRNRHFGFLFKCKGIGKSNKMYHYFSFSSYHITRLQPSNKNINTHSNEISNPWSKSKVLAFFVIFLHTALCNRKPRDFEKLFVQPSIERVCTMQYAAVCAHFFNCFDILVTRLAPCHRWKLQKLSLTDNIV